MWSYFITCFFGCIGRSFRARRLWNRAFTSTRLGDRERRADMKKGPEGPFHLPLDHFTSGLPSTTPVLLSSKAWVAVWMKDSRRVFISDCSGVFSTRVALKSLPSL